MLIYSPLSVSSGRKSPDEAAFRSTAFTNPPDALCPYLLARRTDSFTVALSGILSRKRSSKIPILKILIIHTESFFNFIEDMFAIILSRKRRFFITPKAILVARALSLGSILEDANMSRSAILRYAPSFSQRYNALSAASRGFESELISHHSFWSQPA